MDESDMPREFSDHHDTRHLVGILWRRYWHLSAQVDHLSARQRRMEATMATQAEIDDLTTQVQAIDTAVADAVTTLTADDSAIAQAIADLQAANPNVDVTALQAAVAQAAADVQSSLGAAVAATTALIPAPTA